jgi:hypothetical protein
MNNQTHTVPAEAVKGIASGLLLMAFLPCYGRVLRTMAYITVAWHGY